MSINSIVYEDVVFTATKNTDTEGYEHIDEQERLWWVFRHRNQGQWQALVAEPGRNGRAYSLTSGVYKSDGRLDHASPLHNWPNSLEWLIQGCVRIMEAMSKKGLDWPTDNILEG